MRRFDGFFGAVNGLVVVSALPRDFSEEPQRPGPPRVLLQQARQQVLENCTRSLVLSLFIQNDSAIETMANLLLSG